MRVCHVIHALTPGGAEQVLVDLAGAAAGAGLEMSVLSLMAFDERAVHRPVLERTGVQVRSLGLSTRWDPRAFARADATIRALRPDVLHTHLKHADLVGASVALRRGMPQVSTLHVIEDRPSGLGHVKRAAARLVRDRVAARTIAVSEAQRAWYVERLGGDPQRTVLIRNGVTAPPVAGAVDRAALRAEFAVPEGALVAVTAAVLRPGKGIPDLLDALQRLPTDVSVVVVVAGDGPEREALEARAARSPTVTARVRFAGWRTDVPALLAAADLVVHPSHADALPTAVVQAMAAGVPAVATDVGGTAEVVGQDAGRLVPPHNPVRLAEALADVLRDHELRQRMASCARARYESEFRVDAWAQRLAAMYAEVLAASDRPPTLSA